MKRILFMSLLSVATMPLLFSCNKSSESDTTPAATTKPGRIPLTQAKWIKKIIDFMGVKATLVYQSGCYHGHYEHHPDGTVIVDVTCNSGCEICMGRITLGKVGTDAGGNLSVLDVAEPVTDYQWAGLAGLAADGSNLIMGFDKRLITQNTMNALFNADGNFSVAHDFTLSQEAATKIGLDVRHMVVKAGIYETFEDGNILWWNVPIASMGAPME